MFCQNCNSFLKASITIDEYLATSFTNLILHILIFAVHLSFVTHIIDLHSGYLIIRVSSGERSPEICSGSLPMLAVRWLQLGRGTYIDALHWPASPGHR